MPTLPIYIRVDDLEKWKALPNKSEFIHNALNTDRRGEVSPGVADSVRKLSKALKPIQTTGLCKHGNPKGSCFHKEAARLKCNV